MGDIERSDLAARSGPPSICLSGRDGAGKRTLAIALARRGVVAGREGDVHLYCFAGGVRAADRRALDRLRRSVGPVLAVCCQADLAGSWRAADRAAAAAGAAAGMRVLPVMAILDSPLEARCFDDLAHTAASGLGIDGDLPALACRLGPRAYLLDLLGGYGLGCAVGALRQCPGLTRETLGARLAELSGVDAVAAGCAVPPVRLAAIRAAELDRRLHRLLISEPVRRDEIEARLLDRVARSAP